MERYARQSSMNFLEMLRRWVFFEINEIIFVSLVMLLFLLTIYYSINYFTLVINNCNVYLLVVKLF
jgi:hypothetical protein